MSDITGELNALAEAFTAYGRPKDAKKCFDIIEATQAVRKLNDVDDVAIDAYVTNAADYNRKLDEQQLVIDKLKHAFDRELNHAVTSEMRLMVIESFVRMAIEREKDFKAVGSKLLGILVLVNRVNVDTEGMGTSYSGSCSGGNDDDGEEETRADACECNADGCTQVPTKGV